MWLEGESTSEGLFGHTGESQCQGNDRDRPLPAEVVKSDQSWQTPENQMIRCPSCYSEAVYRYGRTRRGDQRHYCLSCDMQFTGCTRRTLVRGRPLCPSCEHPMHFYMRRGEKYRFRCSMYPKCREYVVLMAQREDGPHRPIISVAKETSQEFR